MSKKRKEIVSLLKADHIPESPLKYTGKSVRVIQALLDEVITLATDIRKLVHQKSVLVKPNLVRPYLKESPAITTDPRVIAALLGLLKDHGAGEIALGENPGYGLAAKIAFKQGGFVKLCKSMGVTLVPFDECKTVIKTDDRAYVFREIEFPAPLFEYDVLFNLPKMKTHMHTTVSLGMKNMQGAILDHQRLLYHREDIHHKIVDTVLMATPRFNIIDGLWAMEGQAPFFGSAVTDMNTLVAGENVAAVDCVGALLMGFDPDEITHIRLAREMGFKGTRPDEITLIGTPVETVARKFKRPVVSSVGVFTNIRCIEGGVCSGCQSALRHSLDKLHHEGRLDKHKRITVLLGHPHESFGTGKNMQGDIWLFGDCTGELVEKHPELKRVTCQIDGCPPHVLDLYKWFCAPVSRRGK